MKFINLVTVLYYELNAPVDRVRRAFPSALEFKNPSPESFLIVQSQETNARLLIIDLKNRDRHVFVLSLNENLVLINDTLPRVFMVSRKGLKEFFRALLEGDLSRFGDRGGRKGKKWRFLIDGLATLLVVSFSDHLHTGLWGVILLSVVVSVVECTLGPQKGKVKFMINELDESAVVRMYRTAEKKGKVTKIFL